MSGKLYNKVECPLSDPGTTSAIKPGDVVEVHLEGVGVLRNTVAAGHGSSSPRP